MNFRTQNIRGMGRLAQAHLGLLFLVFTLLVAGLTLAIFLRAIGVPARTVPSPTPAHTAAINVNRSLRDSIFSRFDQRVAGVTAALFTPVKDPF